MAPTKEELGQLPRHAAVAFAARCARRVLPLFVRANGMPGYGNHATAVLEAVRLTEAFAAHAAHAVHAAANAAYPVRAAARRDYELLRQVSQQEGWDDDTPVPDEFFGPLWPEGPPEGWLEEE